MAQSAQLTSSALRALLQDGKFTGSWTLDASRSQVRLKTTSMWGLAPVKGVFRQVAGNGTVTPGGDVTGTITVTAASIDTKMKKRDQHLRSADFFDVDNYPQITFAVHQVKPSGSGVMVIGSLTVRGRTRPVSFDAAVASVDNAEVWLDGEVKVNRADYGLTWNQLGTGSMKNTITVHAVFTQR